MPTQRLSMRRIKQLLTMRFGAGASTREIARELGVAHRARYASTWVGQPRRGLAGRWRPGRHRREPDGAAVRQRRRARRGAVPC